MSRSVFPLTLLGWLLVLAPLPAQDEPQAIVDRAVKAHGGAANLTRFKARQVKIKGTLHLRGGISFTKEDFYQLPSQIKEITVVEVNGKKSTIIMLLNGDQGSTFLDGQPQVLSDKVLAELKEAAHLARVSRFVGFKEQGYELAALPEIKVEGKTALGVKVSAKGFRDVHLYFDKDSALLVKRERKTIDVQSDKTVTEEALFSIYKEVDGVKTPTHMTVYHDGKKLMEAVATDIKHLEKLDEGLFTKP